MLEGNNTVQPSMTRQILPAESMPEHTPAV
jgi:hypothetical protein